MITRYWYQPSKTVVSNNRFVFIIHTAQVQSYQLLMCNCCKWTQKSQKYSMGY